MASTNIDRTAIVNLAVINEATVGSEPSSINFELRDQVHDFSYSVISDNEGDSYVFKIELINFNDSIHKALSSSFGAAMKHNTDNTGFIDSKTTLTSFPKLLIQWGYPDTLSNTHIAQISDIKYKFTQAKEKILIIEAVNAGNWADVFWKNNSTTHETVSMSRANNNTIFQNRSVADLILSILQGALKSVEGIEVDSNIDVSLLGSLDKEYYDVIQLFMRAEMKKGIDNFSLVPALFAFLTNDNSPDEHLQSRLKFEAIKRFFKFIGFGVENTLASTKEGPRTRADSQALLEEQKKELYYPIQKSIPLEDTGTYATYTEFIPASQLKDTSKIENLNPAFESIVKENLFLDFNSTSSPLWDSYASNIAFAHNELNPSNLIDERDVTFILKLSTVNQNAIKSGATVMEKVLMVNGVTSAGITIGLDRYAPPSIKVTPDDVIAGDNPAILQHHLRKVDYQVQKEKAKLADEAVFHDAQLNKYNEDSLGEPQDYDSLPSLVKSRLLYNNIKIGLYTTSNESVLQTVKNVIKKLNLLATHSDNLISLKEHTPSISPKELSFSDILSRVDTKIPTTMFTFAKGLNNDKSLQGKLREINCFPNLQLKDDDSKPLSVNTVELSYGKSNSVVKYFDFAGDIRYLANMAATKALDQSLESTYQYLTTNSIITIVPVIDALINSDSFITELKAKFRTENIIISKLELLRDQIKKKYEPELTLSDNINIDMRFFEQLGFISEYISTPELISDENVAARNANREPTFNDKQFTTAQVFFQVLASDLSTALLFSKKSVEPEKDDKLVELLKKESEGLTYSPPSKTYVYSLKRNNIFDNFEKITNKLEEDQEGKQISAREMRVALADQFRNKTEPWSVIIKTLGIPEMDTLDEITTPRVFDFTVHDLSREAQTEGNTHWLSGKYRPLAINHKINNSVGYISEFSLLKDVYID